MSRRKTLKVSAIIMCCLWLSGCPRVKEIRTQKIQIMTDPAGAKVWLDNGNGQKVIGESPTSASYEYKVDIVEFNSNWWWGAGGGAALVGLGAASYIIADGEDTLSMTGVGLMGVGISSGIGFLIACIIGESSQKRQIDQATWSIGADAPGYTSAETKIDLPSSQHEVNLLLRPVPAGTASARPVSASAVPGPRRAIVAVFDINDVARLLKPSEVAQLTTYLGTAIASTGLYKTIPRDQLRARLLDQKKGTYKACVDESCQIDLGKTMAAQKTLATQLLKVGKKCAVTASLYDLKTETAEKGAMVNTGCTSDELLDAMKQIAQQLTGS